MTSLSGYVNWLQEEVMKLTGERDDARAVAKDLFDNQCRRLFWKSSVAKWEEDYPWLKKSE